MAHPDHNSIPVGDGARKTVTMTFRIDENIITNLRNEAENREISLNTLANQIFKRFVEWGLFEPKLGLIPVPKPILAELFENMSEDRLLDMANRIGRNTVKDIAMFMKQNMDVKSFLDWFEPRMKMSFIEISHQKAENGKHSYTLKHDLGKN